MTNILTGRELPNELDVYEQTKREAREKYGKIDERYPSIRRIALIVQHFTPYLEEIEETRVTYNSLCAYLAWFSIFVCMKLELPVDTKWVMIFPLVGVLPESEYESKRAYYEAYHLGEVLRITEPPAAVMFKELEALEKKILALV